MTGDAEGPGQEGLVAVEAGKAPPQNEAGLLKQVVGIGDVGNERANVGLNAALLLGIQSEKGLIGLRLGGFGGAAAVWGHGGHRISMVSVPMPAHLRPKTTRCK